MSAAPVVHTLSPASACPLQVGFSNLQGVNLESHRNILILGFGLCRWHAHIGGLVLCTVARAGHVGISLMCHACPHCCRLRPERSGVL